MSTEERLEKARAMLADAEGLLATGQATSAKDAAGFGCHTLEGLKGAAESMVTHWEPGDALDRWAAGKVGAAIEAARAALGGE